MTFIPDEASNYQCGKDTYIQYTAGLIAKYNHGKHTLTEYAMPIAQPHDSPAWLSFLSDHLLAG